MRRRAKALLFVSALVAAALSGLPPATSAPTGPAGSRLPSIVEQMVSQIDARSRARTSTPVSSLSNAVVHVDDGGRIELALHAGQPTGPAEESDLTKLGATGIRTLPASPFTPKVGLVEAFVPAAQVGAAAALPWVKAVTTPSYGNVDVGSVTSEGVAFHLADVAQTAGFDGTGFDIGVISDGVTNLAASVALGDLPNTVNVLDAGNGDEGTAMLEIVQDMAPGAGLLFDGTNGTVATHVAALVNLVANGAEIITEDIPFDAEPDFQVGLAAQTAENIAAGGVSVHSSAGNLASRHAARVVATGNGQRPDNTANNFAGCANTPDNVVDIDPGAGTAFDVTIQATNPPAANNTINATLQWSEPRAIFPTVGQGGFTDLNLYVMNAGLTQCLAQSTTVQANGQGDTIEQISFTTAVGTALKLVVDVEGTSSAVAAPTLDLRWRGATSNDPTTRAGSLNPDSNYTGAATSSAAIDAVGGGIEGFSGGGPVQLGSTTVCTAGDPPPCVGAAGGGLTSTQGPTWGAADNVQVTGVGGFGSPFGGTSAAAPHAAACEALVRDARPGDNTTALATARLKATAVDVAPAGVDNVTGAGRLRCFRADPTITTVATSAVFTATSGPANIADTATLANGFNPTGTITFEAFGPNNPNCTGGSAFSSSTPVTGNGVYGSGNFAPLAEGTYRWVVTYGGDGNNSSAVSGCNAPNETSTVFSVCAAPPPFGTLPGNNVQVQVGVIAVGTPGVDVFYGTAGVDRVFGAAGNDIVFGLGGDDQITGGDGLDTLCGGDGNDRITGDAGNDLVVGGNHNDDLTGAAGNDRMIGGSGVVRITGGLDVDVCTPGTGAGSQTVLCETIV